ncbi:YjgN family protein [Rugamonas sp. DEMB1]|uniref:YjgN family protein n=1 Tax=Rugamonas sp. DEMB1 TaxID=3039386 RepID=UPI00244789D9|nr:YjgN family protein [Rugamonas sp. DEMB1]WGG51204.1 YjgN family protein [Rugamonas sp. DEMB1]
MEPLPSRPEAPSAPAAAERLRLHASGAEYFRIWIVNLLLSIVTLGVYTAWAKVRRNQYFYSCTELAGARFAYHGNAKAILKGRVLAVLLFAAYNVALQFSPLTGVLMALAFAAASPWFIWKSLQFRLYNTSYRGLRFHFVGELRDAYRAYLLRPMLNAITVGLATPYIHQRAKAYQHNESRYGAARFSFDASAASFYKLYAGFVLVGGGGAGLLGWLIFSGGAAPDGAAGAAEARAAESVWMIFYLYAWLFLLFPLFMNMLQNLVWNHTRLEGHQFRSDMRWGRLLFITVSNYVAVVCTLGLFIPFAQVRALRYRLESISLRPDGGLDDIAAAAGAPVAALGEGAADLMDFDLSL